MSFLSGLLAQPATVAIGTGLLAGVVTGGAVVATGVLSSPPPQELSLMSCPASENVVARVTAGQSMLVMAKSGDGAWLQLYIGEPGVNAGWARATALKVNDSLDSLPIAGCEVAAASLPPGATPTPTPEVTLPPGVTPSPIVPTPFPTPTVLPTPTPKPTTVKTLPPGATPTPFVPTPLPPPPTMPPPTPTPTPPPTPPPTPVPTANPGPSLSGLNSSYQTFCTTGYSDITVTATDPQGVNHVNIRYTPTGGPQYDRSMSNTSGNVWTYRITPQGWSDGFVSITVTAFDNFNAQSSVSNVDNNGSTSLYTTSFC